MLGVLGIVFVAKALKAHQAASMVICNDRFQLLLGNLSSLCWLLAGKR